MYDTAASTTWAYTYDDDNHMNSATETISGTLSMVVDYKYNAFGNLVEEDVSTGSGLTTVTGTKYVIDSWNPAKDGAIGLSGSDVIADLRASDGTLETRYVWGDNVGQLFGRYDAGPTLTTDPAGTYFTMTDQNGSVRDIVDSAGSDVDTITYDAFGKALTGIGSYSGHYTFDGYDYDAAATKFYLNNARVYDPESGRWLSQDPMGFAAGDSNLYRYVNNAPTNATDPSGMKGEQYQVLPNKNLTPKQSNDIEALADDNPQAKVVTEFLPLLFDVLVQGVTVKADWRMKNEKGEIVNNIDLHPCLYKGTPGCAAFFGGNPSLTIKDITQAQFKGWTLEPKEFRLVGLQFDNLSDPVPLKSNAVIPLMSDGKYSSVETMKVLSGHFRIDGYWVYTATKDGEKTKLVALQTNYFAFNQFHAPYNKEFSDEVKKATAGKTGAILGKAWYFNKENDKEAKFDEKQMGNYMGKPDFVGSKLELMKKLPQFIKLFSPAQIEAKAFLEGLTPDNIFTIK